MPSKGEVVVSDDGMVTTLLPECKCPTCKGKLDAATGTDGQGIPEPGDISICFNCGELLEYDQNMVLNKLTAQALSEMDDVTKKHLKEVQQHIQNFRVLH